MSSFSRVQTRYRAAHKGAPYDITPIAAGSTTTLTAVNDNATVLLNTASGSVITLPAATGSGKTYHFVTTVTVTSNSHKILAASTSDFIQGVVFTEDGGTATGWYSDGSANHSIAMNGTTTGGYIGDSFTFTDVAANMWQANGNTKSTGTAATPFSTSAT